MRIISSLFLLVIMLVGLTFASLNPEVVHFNYFAGTKDIALSLLLVFSFGGGIILGLLVALLPWLKAKRDYLRLKNRLKVVEKELENLRSLPIKGD